MSVLAFVLAIAAAASSADPTGAESAVWSQTEALCVRYRADPTKVLTAAKADGWQGAEADLGGIAAMFDLRLSPNLLLKTVDGQRLVLKVEETEVSTSSGVLQRRLCSVGTTDPVTLPLADVVAKQLGEHPSMIAGPLKLWAWTEGSGNWSFLSVENQQDLERAATIQPTFVLAASKETERAIVMLYALSLAAE